MSPTKQHIDFVIYNANLLLQIKTEEKSKIETVWFLRNKSVVLMDWGQPLMPGLCD